MLEISFPQLYGFAMCGDPPAEAKPQVRQSGGGG